MPPVESNVYETWVAKQTAKGTPATVATKKVRQVAGDLNVNRDDGAENFSDGTRFGDQQDFVNTILGNLNPTIQAQPDTLAYLCWLFFGGETVTGTGPYVHEFVPGTNLGFWSTWWKKIGLAQIVRQKFNDCKITSLRFEGSTANKIVKVLPTGISLDAGEIFTADPTPALTAENAFVYTEGEGTFTLDGTIYRGHSQFAVVVDDATGPHYGDSVRPYDLIVGNAAITLEGITLLLDAESLARYYTQLYGTATPSAGAKPISTIPPVGSYSFDLTRGSGATARQFKLELPGVKWSPDLAIAPNPDGGAIELAFGGSMRKVAGQPGIRVTVKNGDIAYTT